MASVTLRTLWINLVSDPSDAMTFPFMSELTVTTTQRGEVRPFAGGRSRFIGKAGKDRQPTATLPGCTREQVSWLEEHVGDLVCVRDDRGRKLFAVFLTVPASEARHSRDRADVSLSLTEVSHSEAV